MAAIQIQFATPAITRTGDGGVTLNFSDGSTQDFETLQQFQFFVTNKMTDFGPQGLKALACCHLMAADPLMDSPALWDGKTFTLDPEQATAANVFKKV